MDEDETLYIADFLCNRIVEWNFGATSGQVVAGGLRPRITPSDQVDMLNRPTDVIVNKEISSLIICDRGNQRVMRWPRRNSTSGETIILDIHCFGLTMDDQGFLYVSDTAKHEVRRYRMRETSNGTVVAGGNGRGNHLNQLNEPAYIFIDRDYSVYITDNANHRVMKWVNNAKEGILVAGGHGPGNNLNQLLFPGGLAVDSLGTIYIADYFNNRVMRWYNGATHGNVIVGGNGKGLAANQLSGPVDLLFDFSGNLYVLNTGGYNGGGGVNRFNIE